MFNAKSMFSQHAGGVSIKNKRSVNLKNIILPILFFLAAIKPVFSGEDTYHDLSELARGKGDASLFYTLNTESRKLNWENAAESRFTGHLRLLKAEKIEGTACEVKLYMVRNVNGQLHILSVPPEETIKSEGVNSPYHNLRDNTGNKLQFETLKKEAVIDGEAYSFIQLQSRPEQLLFDTVFHISIVLMLFFVMLGMGFTLTANDFKLVFQKPKGIITGACMQWIAMPLIAVAMGHILGFYESYPFIFVGMVLIAATPGGVTSNLMTYYAKGDLALSVSLTSLSTVLSLFFTPFLLVLYCSNVPEVNLPVALIVQTIIVMVIIPLAIGMFTRSRWEAFAKRVTPFFSLLGVIALLFLISAGIITNLDMVLDLQRYGIAFYSMVFMLTLTGMFIGGLGAKLMGVNNYQARAVSLETGLRNSALAMAIAILMQDHMGDFHSSMFLTSAIFGLFMYVSGFISIKAYKKLLPIQPRPEFEFSTDDEVIK